VPITILEVTDISGLGQMAQRVYEELGMFDLSRMKVFLEKRTLSKVKGGQKMIEKIAEYILKTEKI